MAVAGVVDLRFTCSMTMEQQIHCEYTVKLTCSKELVIDKTGTPALELTYTYNPEEGLIPQAIGVTGLVAGRFKIFADITSPYYIDANGPVVKKDHIDITISAPIPDGWDGLFAGCVSPGSIPYITSDSDYVVGDLRYKYTNTTLSGIFQVGKTAGWQSNLNVVCKIVKPNMAVVYDTYCLMDQIGAYYFYPIEEFRIDDSGTGSISNSTFTADRSGDPTVSTSLKSSGLIYDGLDTIAPSPYNNPFNTDVGNTIDYQANGTLSVHNPDTTTSVGAHETISYISGVKFNFSGYITTPGGETWAASFGTIPTRCIRVNSINVATGNINLNIFP